MSRDLGLAPRRSLAVRVRRIDGNLCLAHGAVFLELSRVAESIWKLADGTRSPLDIAAAVAADYGVQPATVAADVEELLAELTGHAMIEWVGSPGAAAPAPAAPAAESTRVLP